MRGVLGSIPSVSSFLEFRFEVRQRQLRAAGQLRFKSTVVFLMIDLIVSIKFMPDKRNSNPGA